MRGGAFLLAAAAVAVVWLTTPVVPLNGGWDSDGRFYGLLLLVFEGAADVADVPAPWRWRPLAPFIASLLPFEPLTSFRVLGMLSAGAGLVLLHGLARRTGFSPGQAALTVVLYAGIFWTVKFPAWSPAYVDAETQLLFLAGLLLARDGRTAALVALLAVAGLQKESLAVLAVPAWVAWSRRSGRGPLTRPSLARLAGLAAVPLFVALAVRVAFPLAPGDPRPPGPLLAASALLATDGTAVRLGLALVSGLGLLWALPLAAPRGAVAFLRREPFWAIQIPLGCALLLGGVDKARLFLYMAPAMAVLGTVACGTVRARVARREGGTAAGSRLAAAWLGVTVLVHLWLGHHLEPMGGAAEYLSRMVPVHAPDVPVGPLLRAATAVAAWAVLTAVLLLRARRPGPAPR